MQVMASKTKIYIVLELVTGGELFDKIVRNIASTCMTKGIFLGQRKYKYYLF